MHSIHHVIDTLVRTPKRSVLATIIHVEGSAYRKEGAMMVFLENAPPVGTLSAGCLEADLELQANALRKSGKKSRTATYDMRAEDDLSWGRGAGCNGTIHILLEVVDDDLQMMFQQIGASLAARNPVKMLRYMYDHGSKVESIWMPADHYKVNQKQVAPTKRHIETGMISQQERQLFIQTFQPKRRLYLFGAGPDVIPLASFAAQINFSVYVWDWRPAYQLKENYPHATLLTSPDVERMLRHTYIGPGDSIVIMTHDFQMDREILSSLPTDLDVDYIGILGPRKRTKRLLNDSPIPSYLHSPVGMDIGAEGPAEIAISIIADIVQANRHVASKKTMKGDESHPHRRSHRYFAQEGR